MKRLIILCVHLHVFVILNRISKKILKIIHLVKLIVEVINNVLILS